MDEAEKDLTTVALNPFGDPDVTELNPFEDPDSEGNKFFFVCVVLFFCTFKVFI